MPWPTCDVCEHRQAFIVACSGIGPMSLAYCDICGALDLEPVGLVAAMLAEGMMESGAGTEYAVHSMQVGLMTVHGNPPVARKGNEP